MTPSVFDHMARLVSARDLQSKLGPQLDGAQSASDAWASLCEVAADEGYDPMDRISLVMDQRRAVGWVGLDMLDRPTVIACAEPLQASSLLSADTTALELADVFCATTHHFFFVLDHHSITGTLHYEDLFRLPFRLCIFALTLQLEDSALKLASTQPRESWEVLSESRRQKAEDVYDKRYGRRPDSTHVPLDQLLGCTAFCDKGTIIKKRRLLPTLSGNKIESVFGRADEVRNACAHTNPDQFQGGTVLERENLRDFILQTQSLIDDIGLVLNTTARDLNAGQDRDYGNA